jgi:hypothetical protein
MLEFTLEDNELAEKAGDLRAQAVNVGSYTRDDIIDRIMKIGAGLTRSDIVAVFEAEKQVIADGGAEAKVDPSGIMAVVPTLTAGAYRVRIVTQSSSGKYLKSPRTFTRGEPRIGQHALHAITFNYAITPVITCATGRFIEYIRNAQGIDAEQKTLWVFIFSVWAGCELQPGKEMVFCWSG